MTPEGVINRRLVGRAQRLVRKAPNLGCRLPVQCNTIEIADHRVSRLLKLCATSLASWPIASILWARCRAACTLLEQQTLFDPSYEVRDAAGACASASHPFVRSKATVPSSRPASWQSAARSGSQGCRRAAVFLTVERDALYQASQDLGRCPCDG